MIGRRPLVVLSVGLLLTGQITVTSPAASAAPAPPARPGPAARAAADFGYDGAGQLRGVSTSADGAGARYSYDETGNPTSVDRSAAGELTVSAISPSRAPVGASVTISGTGFAASTGGNTVKFNGTTATVTAAGPAKIVATVPSGVTSGAVTVTTGSATATSGQSFTVTAATPAPAISGFSPGTGAEGTVVTISGTGFAPAPAENNVSFGRTRARVTAATSTTLTVVVPGAAVSGKISVATPGGLATSGTDFVAVTTPFGASDIGFSGSLTADGTPTTVSFGTAGKVAVLRFTGTKGQRLSLGLTGSTVGDVAIYGYTPYGGSIGRDEFDSPWLRSDLLGGWSITPLPTSGTYQIVLKPTSATATGSLTATLSSNVLGTLNLNGAATTVNLARAGQQAEMTIDAAANQRIGLGVSNVALSSAEMTVEIRDPSGVPVVFPRAGSYGYWRYTLDLPDFDVDFTTHVAGKYTILFRSGDLATGSLAVTASTPHAAGTLTIGTPRSVTASRPGQDSRLTFAGTAGQNLGLEFTDYALPYYPRVELTAPDGSTLATIGVQSSWTDLPVLPATGTYTLTISANSSTGTYTVGLWQPQSGGALSLTGAGTSVSLPAGRAVALTVTGTAGGEVTLAFSNWTLPASARMVLSVVNPAGVVVSDAYVYSLDAVTVPTATAGTYRAVLRPGANSGSVLVTASPTLAGGALTVGTSKTVTSPRLGQPTRMTFTGAVAQRLSMSISNYGYDYEVWADVRKPDGSTIYSGWLSDVWLAMEPFTVAGTYSIELQPRAATGGSLTFALVQAIDAGATTVGGSAKVLTATPAGRYVDTTLTVTANQRLSFGFTGWTFAATSIYVRLAGPTGVVAISETIPKVTALDTYQLTAGTYRLSVMATGGGTGSVTVTASAQISGGSWALNAAKTQTVTRTGQSTWYTYAGTAGQNLALAFTSVTNPYYPSVWVRRPNGAELAWLAGAATVNIPTLPTTGTYEILISPNSATGNATATLRTRSAAAAARTPDAHPSTVVPGPAAQPARPAGVRPAHTALKAKKHPVEQVPPAASSARAGAAWQPSKANLAGNDWSTGRGAPQRLTDPLRAEPGATALSGRVRTIDDKPLADVTVSVDGVRARTDANGQFLLKGLRAGHRVLRVDGVTASSAGRAFGLHDIGVDLAANQTTVLPYTVWLTQLDTANTVKFASPAKGEVTISTPVIPGLEVKLPDGAVVRDVHGKVVTELGITAIPIDRAPFPLPRSQVPSYFTVQPGSSYIFPAGARVIYPNFTHAKPGASMDFWHYDPAGKGWFIYGKGIVTPDGKRVEPTKGTEVYQFTGAMLITPGEDPPPEEEPQAAGGGRGGDPVDLGTGLLLDQHTDLVVDDVIPIEVSRTYQQSDTGKRSFGIGSYSNYGLDLYSENRFYDCWLILPGGSRVRFHRVSPGGEPPNGYINSVFAADPTPTVFGGSTLAWNGDGWDLKTRDGTTYVFGDEAPLQAIRDKFGNTVTIARAPAEPWTDGIVRARGPITQVTSPNGKWIRYSYDSGNRVTKAEDVLGRSVSYTYYGDGRLHTVTDVNRGVTTYTYEGGRLKTIEDARGTTFLTNEYDSNGRVRLQTLPGGATYRFAYTTDAAGQVTAAELTDPNGRIRRVTFNAGGAVTSETEGHGTGLAQTTTITRDPTTNLPTATVDALNRRTEFGYDSAGNVRTTTELAGTPDARTTTTEYGGPFGQLSRIVDPLQHETKLGYQPDGALHTVTDALQRTITYDTNESGQVTRITDVNAKQTAYGLRLGDVATVTDPLGNVTRAFTDSAGPQLVLTDAGGGVVTAGYDAASRLTTLTDALGRTTRYEYDANGNLHRVTDPRDHTTVYDYDASDRLVLVTDPLNRESVFTHYADGKIHTATTARGKQTVYDYDELGRVKLVRFGAAGSTQESQVGYTYDAGNRTRTITDSASGTITTTPDAFDRPVSITDANGTVSYTYDAADRRRTMTVPGQPETVYDYNATDQLTSTTRGSDVATIGYDAAGRRQSLSLPAGVSQTYGYDDANRLTSLTYKRGDTTIGDLAYTLDAVGRVTHLDGSYARVALPEAFGPVSYDAADQRAGSTYDDDGNVTGDGDATYTWNARGELTGRTTATGTFSYAYDGLGRRAERTAGGVATGYVYDGLNPVQEKAGGQVTATILSGGLDEVFARTTGGGSQSLLRDALGSTVAGASASTVDAEYTYGPFGTTTADGDDLGNPSRFTGREDEGDGLYYYRARYYSADQGRFLSRDPLGLASGDTNPYTYVLNQPTGLTDPMGTKPTKPPTGGDDDECTPGPDDGGEDWVDPENINFSQRTISANDYAAIMRAGLWDWNRSPLTVIDRGGQLVSYDNRRLDAARQVRSENPNYRVKVQRVDPNSPNPAKSTGKSWDQSFEQRMRSKRNQDANGCRVPWKGLYERPDIE